MGVRTSRSPARAPCQSTPFAPICLHPCPFTPSHHQERVHPLEGAAPPQEYAESWWAKGRATWRQPAAAADTVVVEEAVAEELLLAEKGEQACKEESGGSRRGRTKGREVKRRGTILLP